MSASEVSEMPAEVVPLKEQVAIRGQHVFLELMTNIPPGITLTWWLDWPTNSFYVGQSRNAGACWGGPIAMLSALCELGVPEEEWAKRVQRVADWIQATASSIAEDRINEACKKNLAAGS